MINGWRDGGPDASGPFDRHGARAGQAADRSGQAPPLRLRSGQALRVYGRAGGGEVEGGSGTGEAMVVLTSEALGAHMKAVQRPI